MTPLSDRGRRLISRIIKSFGGSAEYKRYNQDQLIALVARLLCSWPSREQVSSPDSDRDAHEHSFVLLIGTI